MAGENEMVKVHVYGVMRCTMSVTKEMTRKEYERLSEEVEREGDEALIDAFDLSHEDPSDSEFEAYDFEIVKPKVAKVKGTNR